MATRTIGTEIVLSGEKQFNDAMKSVNNNLKNLRSDLSLVSAEFDGNANSMEALTARENVLKQSVEQHRAKVNALQQMYEQQKSKYGENSAAADRYKQQLNQATAALMKEESALRKTSSALDAAKAESNKYVPVTQKLAAAVKKPGQSLSELKAKAIEAAGNIPVLAETMDIAAASAKVLAVAGKGAAGAVKGVGTAAGGLLKGTGAALGGVAKGVGILTAASAAGVAALGVGGVMALTKMAGMAKEAAAAAKAAKDAGETLTASQQQWLAYSDQLGALDSAVAGAKSALAGILLPTLSSLTTEGAAFLNDFSADMAAAAGDTGAQTKVLSDYIVKGATMIKEKLPEYMAAGKELFSGLIDGLSDDAGDLTDMGLDLVYDLLDEIINAAPELAEAGIALVQKLTQSLIDRGPELTSSAVKMVSDIVTGLAQAAPTLIPMATQLAVTLVTALLQNSPQLLMAGLNLVLSIIEGILSVIGDVGETAGQLIDVLVESMLNSDSEIIQVGGKVVQWIKDGIAAGWDALVSWFDGIWSSLFGERTVDVSVNSSGGGPGLGGSDMVHGSHASGLSYVPFDGYLARLHRGEAVLTAAEASAYRGGNEGQPVKQFNMTIQTQSLSREDMDMLVTYVNGKLGDDL